MIPTGTEYQIDIPKIIVFVHRDKTCSNIPTIFQINLPTLPVDTKQFFRKTSLHYLYIKVTNQNIRYILEVLHFGTRAVSSNEKKLQETSLFKAK